MTKKMSLGGYYKTINICMKAFNTKGANLKKYGTFTPLQLNFLFNFLDYT